uniref:Uncharacterized protein n=1 Tax=Arundo donax TaxID=35708 RepID=A0A0A9HXC9_ARUDO
MIFMRSASIVPSFFSDSSTSSGRTTFDDDPILPPPSPPPKAPTSPSKIPNPTGFSLSGGTDLPAGDGRRRSWRVAGGDGGV